MYNKTDIDNDINNYICVSASINVILKCTFKRLEKIVWNIKTAIDNCQN